MYDITALIVFRVDAKLLCILPIIIGEELGELDKNSL